MTKEELSQALGGIYGGFSCEIENVIDAFEKLQQENQQLHSKVDKAIRYIKKNKHYIDIEDMNMYLYEDDIKKVLEILKGDKNE